MPRYEPFEPHKPRPVDDGIKAHSRRGDFVEHWWAERWIASLEQITDAGRLRRGRSYARGGQVVSIKETKGEIQARVQGSEAKPYRVTIRLQPLSDRQWQAVLEALAGRAIFTAQLLAGEMPNAIEEAFTAAGVSLLPSSTTELVTSCSCPDWANPCKHVAAVHYILGEQFDEDPFLIFRLRGRSREQIMAALHEQRQDETAPAISEEQVAYQTQVTPPLSEMLPTFWQLQHSLDHFTAAIQPPAQPYPVLRRLGPASFAPELEAGLGAIYDAMTQETLRIALVAMDAETDVDAESAQGQSVNSAAHYAAE